jgi:type VI secretion system protein ImpF
VSRLDPNQALMPSIVDRLIDPDSGGTTWRRGYGIAQMIEVVHRDLEDLLNTRQTSTDLPEVFEHVHKSIVAFGLPDLISLNAVSSAQREEIGRLLEGIVSQFEPRLKDVRARIVDAGNDKDRHVKFHIEARLCLEPAPEVAFDTVLELATGHYTVESTS